MAENPYWDRLQEAVNRVAIANLQGDSVMAGVMAEYAAYWKDKWSLWDRMEYECSMAVQRVEHKDWDWSERNKK